MSRKHDEQTRNTLQNAGVSRRKALKKLILGGGVLASMPDRWSKPVVESVLLPAHAQASPILPLPTTATPQPTPGPGITPGRLQIDNKFRVAIHDQDDLGE